MSDSKGPMAPLKNEKEEKASPSRPPVARSGKDNGDLSLIEEVAAMISLGIFLSWYYVVVVISIICVLTMLFCPPGRLYAGTFLALFWSTAYWPVDYKEWDAFTDSLLFTLWRRYFNYEWMIETELDPKEKYVFCEFPHGIFPMGQFLSISVTEDILPNTRICGITASVLFRLPLFRHIFSWIGTRPASTKNIANIFAEGHHCAITVGGVAEMFLISSEKERLYCKKHKGFVREAIKNGAHLVPIFIYGNTTILNAIGEKSRGIMGTLKRISRKLKMSVILFYGRFGLPIPFRHTLRFVGGKPVMVTQDPKPTEEMIEKVHAEFLKALEQTYYKFRPDWETRELSLE